MAIEDAAVLAEYVSTSSANALPEALARYETLRRPRTSGIQLGSRKNRELYHLRAPRSWVRNLRLRSGGGRLSLDWWLDGSEVSA